MGQNTPVGQSGIKTTTITTKVSSPLQVPPLPPVVIVHKPNPIFGNVTYQLDGFMMEGGCCLLCIHDGVAVYIFPFFVKRIKDAGSVGCVAQSEKSVENSQ